MKLRIHANSLRLRVTRPELDRLQRDGALVESLTLAAGVSLRYSLRVVPGPQLDAVLVEGGLDVLLPRHLAEQWYDEREVGVRGAKAVGADQELVILIEKDFECLIPREGEDQSAHFPNPART